MRRVIRIHRAGAWNPALATHRAVLGFEDRYRRRRAYETDGGLRLLLDEAETVVLHDGDALECSDGLWVGVVAAAEAVVEVRAGAGVPLARLAWHLGNRHLPAEIHADRLLIRDDHVIVDMLQRLGASLKRLSAAFTPEAGAYAGATHGHGQDHPHAHHHPHAHDHPHEHDHPHGHGHEHPHRHD